MYNLLRLNRSEDPSLETESWTVEDLRQISSEELFERLQERGVFLDRRGFFQFAEECDTPEELADLLLPDEATEEMRDPFYLLVFELWRRLLPEKQSLSVFCDELDHRIFLYDQEELESDELIQDALANLMEILDENADVGVEPSEILKAISEYSAHDIESFIYDYVTDLLDSGNSLYASELIEGFSPYVEDPLWFDFLRIRLVAFTDIGKANLAMRSLLSNQLEFLLLFEMIHFLSVNGEHELFKLSIKKALPLLTSQEELSELILCTLEFYQRLDEEGKEKEAHNLLKDVSSKSSLQPEDLKALKSLLS